MKSDEKSESAMTADEFREGLICGYFNSATLSKYSAAEQPTESASSN